MLASSPLQLEKVRLLNFKLALAAVVGIWLTWSTLWPEPQHKGYAVSKWVREWVEVPDSTMSYSDPRLDPIYEIGSNAVPYLIQEIERGPGLFGREWYQAAHKKLPPTIARWMPTPRVPETIQIRSYWTLTGLRENAGSAVPFLMSRLNTNDHLLDFVAHTLATVGDCSTSTIPQLTVFLKSPDAVMSRYAARIIACIDPKHSLCLLPTAMDWMSSTNEVDRRFGCIVLDYMGPEARLSPRCVDEAVP